MKMQEALDIINSCPPKGFMVAFEKIDGYILRSDHFPDKHAGESLIPTEEEAWELAGRFADKTKNSCVNFYVIKHDFTPVEGYKNRKIRDYP